MTRQALVFYTGVLVLLGAGWGITQPLSKIAVSTGYQHFGLIFWQLVIGSVLMAAISAVRGKGAPFHPRALKVYVIIALIGTVIPNSTSFQAIAHLPSGVVSILLSLIPMIAFPMALGLGLERFNWRRFAGLMAGLSGVMLLVLPEASLPEAAMLAWIPVALVAPFFYAFEGNYVAKWGTEGLDPVQVLFGASVIGALIALPLALGSGQLFSLAIVWTAPEWALAASSTVHVLVYTGYVWLVGRAGPVFAVQVSYLVTGFGVCWAMLILGESYSPYIWAALALVLSGVFLVQPRQQDALAAKGAIGDTASRAKG
ncbi:DMT family transporter [Thalassococcus sp. S3]|uniref:DMT family transporter n=1 Tax=Thalassococcus sp. S3 TaxID=2017482 RepID=UPI0010244881|nr:DMT family transporter [Thalassococcus sp. S3]QBF32896.1 EamA family transporter [Thalassococcus sp. S3]